MPSISELKKTYLEEAGQESAQTHPFESPVSLLCPISGTFMNEPVITPEGKVYNKSSIETCLRQKSEDPLTRNKLAINDLQPFNELTPYIQSFISRQKEFSKKRNALLQEARKLAHHNPVPQAAPLFVCPISKKMITTAVISAEGQVYDKKSLSHGEKPRLSEVVDFDEFQEFIKYYNFRHQKAFPNKTEHVEKEERMSPGPSVQGENSQFKRFDLVLSALKAKIGQANQHHLPEALIKAQDLLNALETYRNEYVRDLQIVGSDSQKAFSVFQKKCSVKLHEVKPVLGRDLDWSEYTSNLLKIASNALMSTFTHSSHHFYAVKRPSSLTAVEQAEKDLGIADSASL